VVEGCLIVTLAEQIRPVAAGEFFMFASNQAHTFSNEGDVVVRFVRNVVI
jgi:uncharacterized cupin superfamily protein